jgi:menaquinone-dependent protoporphyrinogen IX oxidase
MFGDSRAEENMQKAFPDELKKVAVSMQLFGGELNINNMKFMDKFIAKMVSKVPLKPGEIVNHGIISENINKLAQSINEA